MTPATQITESVAGRLAEIKRLSAERMSATPVEGALGLVIEELTGDSLTLTAPVPLLDGRPDPLAVLALRYVLVDTAAGLGAATTAKAFGDGGATIELRTDHTAPLHPGARMLRAEGRRLQVSDGAALAVAVLRDDRGEVLARSQGHFAREFGGPPVEVEPPPAVPPPARLPELRDALVLESAADPTDRFVRLPAILANIRGHIHGGTMITLADLVQRDVRAADRSGDAGASGALSMQVDFLRPAACDGTPLACRTEYVRRGRRFSTLRTELVRPDGRPAAIATGLWPNPI